jgi:hypothetical protein
MVLYILIAILWGFSGWFLRVIWNYYTYSKCVESKVNGKFSWPFFIKKYDQDWIMGFAAMVVFSLISDWAWGAFLSDLILSRESEYDPKANVIIGFMSIYIIEKLASRK